MVCDSLLSSGSHNIIGYCEGQEKSQNPYSLDYFGSESEKEALEKLAIADYFIAIGDNKLRKKISGSLIKILNTAPCNALHESSIISDKAILGKGILVSPIAVINSKAVIGDGCICNTGSIVEHECELGDYVHLGPSATLCGNVKVGAGTLIGANSVVSPGIIIGSNVIIGAGSVVVSNIRDGKMVAGNPSREI